MTHPSTCRRRGSFFEFHEQLVGDLPDISGAHGDDEIIIPNDTDEMVSNSLLRGDVSHIPVAMVPDSLIEA